MLVDDHQVVRLGLRTLFSEEADLEVVAEASNTAEALRLTEQTHPDVVLMDIRLPDSTGIDACRKIRSRYPHVQVLMLTSYADDELVSNAIEAGAAGYVLKQLSTDDLLHCVRAVAQGDAVLDPKITRQVLARMQRAEQSAGNAAFRDLSRRELQVLALVTEGKTNAEIAQELILSEKTARNHISAILRKLNVSNRIEAATYAVRHHIENYIQ